MNKRGLASDNYAGVLPEMLTAIADANAEHARSYGYDKYTEMAVNQFKKELNEDIAVTFVFNGTGANVLGIGTVTQSFHSILCANTSHINVDESTAPETFTGCRLVPLENNEQGKIDIATLQKAIIRKGDEHHPQIKVFSIAQPTEYGTVYSTEELKAIHAVLKENDILFHMDGARIFNAIVHEQCSLREMTQDVGVDILSVGGTKVGMLFGEAIIFFNKDSAKNIKYRQKQSMQLPSKMRFISAQFHVLLEKKVWEKSAKHSNAMAQKLYEGISPFSKITVTKPVQVNAVFAMIPREWNETLMKIMPFYVWVESTNEVRWMCSFDTQEEDIDVFIAAIHKMN